MATVRRLGLTRLTSSERNDKQFCVNIIFIPGLQGHPQDTWKTKASAGASHSSSSDDVTNKSRGFSSLNKQRTDQSSATKDVFWPEEYLTIDIPEACVWTYGYDVDVEDFFRTIDKNSFFQHGWKLSVWLDQEINNGVYASLSDE